MNKKRGFTLAELVITIGVIGIVAALALPAINSAKPNEEKMMLKKAYYLTGRTVNELINDDDLYPDGDTETDTGFARVHTDPEATYHGRTYSGNTKFCGLFAARMNVKNTVNCNGGVTFTNGAVPGSGNFTTADGMVWILPISDFKGANNGRQNILVDVNGDKGGNCFNGEANCTKPDRFRIGVDRYGKIIIDDNDALTKAYLTE